MTPPLVLTQRSGPIITVIVWVFFALLLLDAIVRGAWDTVGRFLPALLLGAWLVYLLLWRPAIIVDKDDVKVREILRTTTIPYSQISDVRLSSIVAIIATGPRGTQVIYRPWNAPGKPRRKVDSGLQGGKRPESLDTHPSIALLRTWEKRSSEMRSTPSVATTTRWNTGALAVTAILIIVVIIGML